MQHHVTFCKLVAIKTNCKAAGHYMLIEATRWHQQQYNKLMTVPMRSGGSPQLGLGCARVSAVNKLIDCGARGSDDERASCILCIFMGARWLIAPPAAPMHMLYSSAECDHCTLLGRCNLWSRKSRGTIRY